MAKGSGWKTDFNTTVGRAATKALIRLSQDPGMGSCQQTDSVPGLSPNGRERFAVSVIVSRIKPAALRVVYDYLTSEVKAELPDDQPLPRWAEGVDPVTGRYREDLDVHAVIEINYLGDARHVPPISNTVIWERPGGGSIPRAQLISECDAWYAENFGNLLTREK